MSDKREDYISWDEYFMGVAMLSGMRSKDPNTQVGACIVSPDHKILSMGYNGFPSGCSDDEFPWAREGEPLDNKYFYTTHTHYQNVTKNIQFLTIRYRTGIGKNVLKYTQKHWQHNTRVNCFKPEFLSAGKKSNN